MKVYVCIGFLKKGERNRDFATISDFLMPIFLQPIFVDLRYFKSSVGSNNLSLKYERFTLSGLVEFELIELN